MEKFALMYNHYEEGYSNDRTEHNPLDTFQLSIYDSFEEASKAMHESVKEWIHSVEYEDVEEDKIPQTIEELTNNTELYVEVEETGILIVDDMVYRNSYNEWNWGIKKVTEKINVKK